MARLFHLRVLAFLQIFAALLHASVDLLLSPESTSPQLHHLSPVFTATVRSYTGRAANPSVHQNHLAMEQSESMLAPDRFTVEAQASSEDDAVAAAASAGVRPRTGMLVPPPPPSLDAAPDLESSRVPPREPEESASASVAPPRSEPSAVSPPPPIQAGVASVAASSSDGDKRLLPLERVLASLGYNEMASGAALLAKSRHSTPLLEGWHGAITVFAVPDVFVQASCSQCSRRLVFLEHIALGYYPFSELVATPTVKMPSAFASFCLNLTTEPSSHAIYYARLFVAGVEVSHPELYNDGRYVVHGIDGILRTFSHTSCFDDSHSHHDRPRVCSSATSISMSAVSVWFWIREAIACLRNLG